MIKDVRPATLRKVVKYLEEDLNLSIYGGSADLDEGICFESLMDYDIERILKLRKIYLEGRELEPYRRM